VIHGSIGIFAVVILLAGCAVAAPDAVEKRHQTEQQTSAVEIYKIQSIND